MEYSEQFYSTVLQNMINGFAYHKIITDENNLPIDYEFLDVNKEFEGLTGLKRENVIGRRVTEVLPGIEHSDFNWIEFYGNVALNGTKEKFVQYSAELKKWYMVYVYSNTENYFITIFNDISELKNNEQVLIQQNDEISALYEEIVATEEELRQQVDELTLYSDLLKTSEYRLNSAQQIAHVGNWELNLQNKTIWASEEALRIYGLDISYLNAPFIVFQNLVNANDRPRLDLALDLLIKKNEKYDLEFRIKPANCPKEKIIHSIAQIHYDVFGRPEKVFGVIQDITERKIIELKLKQNNEELKKQFDEIQLHKEYLRLSEERYKALADNSEDIIFSCNVDGVLTAVNKKFCEVSGLSMDKVIGSDLSVLFKSKKEITLLNKILKNIKETGEKRITEIEYTSIEGNFHIYSVVLTPLFDINKQIIGITGTNHDITQLRKDEQTVGHLAYYDSLTDLPNRLLFIDRLKAAMNQAKERYQKVGVIFLDFDNFKKINDTLGHFIGDEVIKEVSKALKRVLKKRETLSRFSGDEFAIFIENITKKEDILSFIYRLLNVFKDSFMVDGNALYMSSSIGISIFPDDGDNVDELLRNADTAMYKAKENGKGHFQFFNADMKEEVFKKLKIEGYLCNALKNNELYLCYQPLIKSGNGKVRGYEALIRWENHYLGSIAPYMFIPIAEETGLIISIGEWVLRTACKKNKEWQDKYGFKTIIAVNVSALQLKHKNFLKMVKRILNETGLKPEFLELEITESIFIDSFELIVEILSTLRNIGVQISLDDFGTGYSSLNYLTDLPLDTLKIDKKFIHRIKEGSNEKAILSSIISLAHNLDLEIVAEGVETKDQLEYLVESNCDNLQGYLLCKPVKENELLNLIQSGKIDLP